MPMCRKNVQRILLSLFALALSLVTTHCSYITPEAEQPVPGLEKSDVYSVMKDGVLSVKKSFFGIEINQETNTFKNKRKTFLCGWAPVVDSGRIKNITGLTASPLSSRHCNIEFHISDDGKNLLGIQVDTNNRPFKDWTKILSIPIIQHYFYEKDVDSRGRELNRYKKVTDRKNWKLSPIMDLDVSRLNFVDITKRPSIDSGIGSSVENTYDVETIKHKGKSYFAFTRTQTNGLFGNYGQVDIRYNFLEFEGTPGFKKTPYDVSASRHINILHILGSRPDGVNQVHYAAHWDLSKPIEVCLNGFPDDYRNYKDIGRDILKEVNQKLYKIGATKDKNIFRESKLNPKYDYDLRCPSITFVEDPTLSMRAPLGISLVNADVRTGEIIWGGTIIWGGLIDYLINRDSESVADAMMASLSEQVSQYTQMTENPYFQDVAQKLRSVLKTPAPFLQYNEIEGYSATSSPQFVDQIIDASILDNQKNLEALAKSQNDQEKKQALQYIVQSLQQQKNNVNYQRIKSLSVAKFNEDILPEFKNHAWNSEQDFKNELLNSTNFNSNPNYNDEQQEALKLVENGFQSLEAMNKLNRYSFKIEQNLFDMDNRIENHYYEWMNALSSIQPGDKKEAARSILKGVILHEWGHALGMGHQFAGNKLPVRGSVPDKVYNRLKAESKNFHNYSSIMDYQSGHTEVTLPYEAVELKIHDELVLQYLYNQKFSSYTPGEDDFRFHDIPPGGVIPSEFTELGKKYITRYLPACSDLDAWKAEDPYCRRWDRGYDAPSIVSESYKEYSETFLSRMNSFTSATGGNDTLATYGLWAGTYNMMNNGRTYYDLLRYQMVDDGNPIYNSALRRIKSEPDALLSFSEACIDPTQAPKAYQQDFAKLSLRLTPVKAQTIVEKEMRKATQKQGLYSSLLQKFSNLIDGRNIADMNHQEIQQLEDEMYEQGLAFTEVQKLCRATKDSLNIAKTLLNLSGPDHVIKDFDQAIVPTGMTSDGVSQDYSKIFGKYNQLGILPIKMAVLDLLTSVSSTMKYGYWMVPKPKYSSFNNGKYAYYAFYPKEFTDVIASSIKNNMMFGDTLIQQNASLSVANLYMSYFLRQAFNYANDDTIGIRSNYIDDIKKQTEFNVSMSPVILEAITKPNVDKSKVFGFNAKIFTLGESRPIDLPEAYVLPGRRAIVKGNEGQIILPLSKIRFISDTTAYLWAIDISYDKASRKDPLEPYSIKNTVKSTTIREFAKCIDGENGLSAFMNSENFNGFTITPGISVDEGFQEIFDESVDKAFDAFQAQTGEKKPTQIECQETVRGVGLIGATALSLNGYILPQVFQYIKK